MAKIKVSFFQEVKTFHTRLNKIHDLYYNRKAQVRPDGEYKYIGSRRSGSDHVLTSVIMQIQQITDSAGPTRPATIEKALFAFVNRLLIDEETMLKSWYHHNDPYYLGRLIMIRYCRWRIESLATFRRIVPEVLILQAKKKERFGIRY